MKREIVVSYTCSEIIEVDIEDYALTSEEIESLVNKKAQDILPSDCDDWEWDWEDENEPKTQEFRATPLDSHWFSTPLGLAASNGSLLIFKDTPIPAEYIPFFPWIKSNILPETEKLFSQATTSLPLHKGRFHPSYLPFKNIKGLKVRGLDKESTGYMYLNNKLIGLLMPLIS